VSAKVAALYLLAYVQSEA